MAYLPGRIKKTISFHRMATKNVENYEIYAKIPDDSYTSGIRIELVDTIKNPDTPTPILEEIKLPFNYMYTWRVPEEAFIDTDHSISVKVNDTVLSGMHYTFNKYSRLLTINHNVIEIKPEDIITLTFYQDIIKRTYDFDTECSLYVKVNFISLCGLGNHNIIE